MNREIQENIDQLESKIKEKIFQAKELKKRKKNIEPLLEEVWNLNKEKFILQAKIHEALKNYKGLIITVGFSAEPIILSILANRPECVYFIYTEESERYLDDIINETELNPSQYKRERMARDSAADSYKLVKNGLKFLTEEKHLNKDVIALDPTGGTKIMSVGCGIAASIFNIDILYVNNKNYDPELRRPEPGSEVLITIPNPFDIYQDDKLIEGLTQLQSFHFSNAKSIFYSIKGTSTNPFFPELLANISEILFSWNMIDYRKALSYIDKTKKLIPNLREKIHVIKEDLNRILTSWELYLQVIHEKIKSGKTEIEKISPLLIYDIKKNADREFYNSNYNNAALKYYRDIEMINQFIFLRKYNLNTQEPDFTDMPQKVIEDIKKSESEENFDINKYMLRRYNKIWEKIYDKMYPNRDFKKREILPHKIGLIAGIIFRSALNEPNCDFNFILKVLQASEKRNNSIYAHGISSVSKKECKRLKKINEEMIKDIPIRQENKKRLFTEKKIKHLIELIMRIL